MKPTPTSWNLGLLYKSEHDPQIELDVARAEKVYAAFEKKYKQADFTSSPSKLLKALKDYDVLHKDIEIMKPWQYLVLQTHLNSENRIAEALVTKYNQRIVAAANKITFFDLNIGKIPKRDQSTFLNYPGLRPYAYALKRIWIAAAHFLSEGEEQLADLLSETSYSMWENFTERILNRQTVKLGGTSVSLPEAAGKLPDLPAKARRQTHAAINAALQSTSDHAEAEVNAIYNYKKVMDERRGFKHPYSATTMMYENSEKSIEALVELVTKSFGISHRFYKLHAKLLGEKKLSYADRQVKIGEIKKKFGFADSVTIVRGVFNTIDPEYADMFDQFIKKRQIDVYPNKGKRGGAYCWGMGQSPTFVLLNHTDDIRSVETLAHEMGHAFHTELSKKQPPRYEHYSTAAAEVASTFFEQAVTAELEKHLSPKENMLLLHNKILGDISTVFRQIACFNFELELHTKIRKEGQMGKKDMARMLQKHLESYIGSAMNVTEEDGYQFVSWSHIRNFFYVYSYAYGQIVSRALFEKWKADPGYSKQIRQFLSAGRSMSPEDIFKSIGVDTSDPKFFALGLKSIEADIIKLEKLAKRVKK